MQNDVEVTLAPHLAEAIHRMYETEAQTIARLEREKEQLANDLSAERRLRYDAERKVEELEQTIHQLKTVIPKKRRLKATGEHEEYTDFKSDGKRKAHAAEPIRSYEDFVAIQNYFLERKRIRDWMMWTVGVSLGLRISDLLSLKISAFLNEDKTFRERMYVIEQKTSKINDCLITESVIDAITKYLDSIQWKFDLDDYLFKSNKTKGKMYEEYGWKILSDAGKALKLPIVIGSHTMRKSFANIAACVDKSSIDMNAITKIQGLLNHSDQRVTMRYLGTYQAMFDRARVSVSDFVLGRTDVHDLIAGNNYTIDDIVLKLDALESKMSEKETTGD